MGDKNPTAVTVTVGDKSTSVKGIFQQQAKAVVGLCAPRKDLTVRRLSFFNRSAPCSKKATLIFTKKSFFVGGAEM